MMAEDSKAKLDDSDSEAQNRLLQLKLAEEFKTTKAGDGFLVNPGRHLSFDSLTNNDDSTPKKQNGAAVRTNSLGSGARTPPIERKSRLSAFGRLFKPWKWKRKKKSAKFEATSRSLERKISVRVNREELVKKGILPPESPISTIPEPGEDSMSPLLSGNAVTMAMQLQQQQQALAFAAAAAANHHNMHNNNVFDHQKNEKNDNSNDSMNRLERPSSLGPGKMTRKYGFPMDSGDYHHSVAYNNHQDRMNQGPDCEQLMLSDLPEPPLSVCEIGPIPPPPMFSSPSPMRREPPRIAPRPPPVVRERDRVSDSESDSDSPRPERRSDSPPPREPRVGAVPLKSALKKRPPLTPPPPHSNAAHHIMHSNFNSSMRLENKENTRPHEQGRDMSDSSDSETLPNKVARRQSLSVKLALRPDRQELINRNILVVQTEKDKQETWEAIGARLIRRLSMRPTAEELVERNILKSQSPAEEKKLREEKKRDLIRKLSFRPTVAELKEKKIIRFSDYIDVTQAHDYDRRADKPWTRLTPRDKAAIRRELNEFKSSEMAVHEESKHLTRFHRP